MYFFSSKLGFGVCMFWLAFVAITLVPWSEDPSRMTYRVGGRSGQVPGVVVGDVGLQVYISFFSFLGDGQVFVHEKEQITYSHATELRGLASIGVQLAKEVGGGLEVGRPAEPSGVATVQVHGDVGQIQLLDGIDGALEVGILGTGACAQVLAGIFHCASDLGHEPLTLGHTHVGDHVGEGV